MAQNAMYKWNASSYKPLGWCSFDWFVIDDKIQAGIKIWILYTILGLYYWWRITDKNVYAKTMENEPVPTDFRSHMGYIGCPW